MTNIRIANKKVKVMRRGDDQQQNWKFRAIYVVEKAAMLIWCQAENEPICPVV